MRWPWQIIINMNDTNSSNAYRCGRIDRCVIYCLKILLHHATHIKLYIHLIFPISFIMPPRQRFDVRVSPSIRNDDRKRDGSNQRGKNIFDLDFGDGGYIAWVGVDSIPRRVERLDGRKVSPASCCCFGLTQFGAILWVCIN